MVYIELNYIQPDVLFFQSGCIMLSRTRFMKCRVELESLGFQKTSSPENVGQEN